jgi:2,4-dienoyl-CoA reductase-like NADH-dependent reductase (Old Yellow Enzyme family)
MQTKLFEPQQIKSLHLKNRLVRSATAEVMATDDGKITDKLTSFYRTLAKGGVGLIITGYAYVQKNGHCGKNQIGIYDDSCIPGLTKLAEAVHKEDGKIALQIAHAGRQTTPALIEGQTPLAPSDFAADPLFNSVPRAMTIDEIHETIDAFGEAAGRCKKAGFDAVQLHATHGYLLAQFLSPFTNLRNDEWGGTTEKRLRFVLEVIKKIKTVVGPDYPVMIKISVEEGVPNGITIDEACKVARALAQNGIDAIEMSGGIIADTTFMMCRGDVPIDQLTDGLPSEMKSQAAAGLLSIRDQVKFEEAYWAKYAVKIKEAIGSVPLMLVGGMKYPQTMDNLVSEKKVDFISMCRALIREPGLPAGMAAGKKSPVRCAYCNRCLAAIGAGHPLKCYN